MRKINAFVFLVVGIFLSGCGPKKYTLHECEAPNTASSCSSTCSVSKEKLQFEFLPDKGLSKIMVSVYTDGNYTRSYTYENCTIFDAKNWVCTENVLSSKFTHQMAKDIFTSYFPESYSSLKLCSK